jgi:hypothetical protein
MRLLFRNTMLMHGLRSSTGSKRSSPVTPCSFSRLLTSGRQKNQDATISLQLFNAKDHNYLLAAVDYAPPIPRQAKRSSVSSWRLSSGVVTDTPLRSSRPRRFREGLHRAPAFDLYKINGLANSGGCSDLFWCMLVIRFSMMLQVVRQRSCYASQDKHG